MKWLRDWMSSVIKLIVKTIFSWNAPLCTMWKQKITLCPHNFLQLFEAFYSTWEVDNTSLKDRGTYYSCWDKWLALSGELQITNPSIYNIIRWVAWTMGQMNCRPSVWCINYHFFSRFLAKFFAKILSIYFFIKLQK